MIAAAIAPAHVWTGVRPARRCTSLGEPLGRPDRRELEGAALDVSDQDFPLLSAIGAGSRQRLSDMQRIHPVSFNPDQAAGTSYLPAAVCIADEVFVGGHGRTLPRMLLRQP